MARINNTLTLIFSAILLISGCAFATDTHNTVPLTTSGSFPTQLQQFLEDEDADRAKDMGFGGFVVANCLGATSGNKVMPTFACTAYTNTGFYVSQATSTIDYGGDPSCADTDTGWTIATKDTTAAPGGNFTRITGTRYAVDCTSATQPSLPDDAVWLFSATISGAAISSVTDLRKFGTPNAIPAESFATFETAVDEFDDASDPNVTLTVSSRMHVLSNTTITSNIELDFNRGGLLDVASGVTLTLNGCPDAGNFQIFTTTGTININDCSELPVEWFGGDPTNTADNVAAINEAMGAIEDASGAAIVFQNGGVYKVDGALTPVLNGGGTRYKAQVFKSRGGAFNKAQIRYTATDSSIMLDFSAQEANLTIRDLNFIGNDNAAPVDATTGTAIKLGSATHIHIENVNIQFFDIGMELTGLSFYGRFENIKFNDNYTYGLSCNACTINGSSFSNSTFSNTVNGTGARLSSSSVNATFRNSYFEGNALYGLELLDFSSALCNACYFELNENYDIYAHNNFSHFPGILSVTNSYFDPDAGQNHQRIRIETVRLYIANTSLWQTANTNPPIQVAGSGSTFPGVAINNWYETADISSNQNGWLIWDDKHPKGMRMMSGDPALGSIERLHLHDQFVNTDADSWAQGYQIILGGRGATAGDPAVTGTTTLGSADVTLSGTLHILDVGDIISIAGETFGGGDSTATVLKAVVGPTITLDKTADVGVAAAAITKQVAKSRPFGIVTVMSDTTTSGSGLQDLYNSNVPGSSMGANGGLRITVAGTKTGANDNKEVILNFGAAGISVTLNAAANDTNDWGGEVIIQNVNDEAVQRVFVRGYNGSTLLTDYTTGTVDTSADTVLQVRGNPTNAGDTITLSMLIVELF